MSLDEFAAIASRHPDEASHIDLLRKYLSKQIVGRFIRASSADYFVGVSQEQVRWLFGQIGETVGGPKIVPICPTCDQGIQDPAGRYCDSCDEVFNDVLPTDGVYWLKVPVIYRGPPTGTSERTPVTLKNPLSIKEDQSYANIVPWNTLDDSDYVIGLKQLGHQEQTDALTRLQKYGLCLLRWEAEPPSMPRIESFDQWLGPIRTTQNDFTGKVKEISPRDGVEANTGDSRARLASHVDGTQDDRTPAVLVFQYQFGATWGGTSTFCDMAAILGALDRERLESIVSTLARADCAECTKTKQRKDGPPWSKTYRGPLITPVSGNRAVAIRFSLNPMLKANEECASALQELRQAVADSKSYVSYTPREGDIVIFDNWRILHGREAVGGRHSRIHDRMWIDSLLDKYAGRYILGVRPLGNQLMVAVEAANRSV